MNATVYSYGNELCGMQCPGRTSGQRRQRRDGVFGEPAGVTGAAGLKKLCEQGKIPADATVVSVVTGNGLKDVANAIAACGEPISIPNDMELLLKAFAENGINVE